jgi:hypothetical protein
MQTFSELQKCWFLALFVATTQNALAVFAVYSSNRDVLSDGACIGGGYGTLVSMAILVVVVTWLFILAVKHFKKPNWDKRVWPLITVALSSTTAVLIGQQAMLRCTV